MRQRDRPFNRVRRDADACDDEVQMDAREDLRVGLGALGDNLDATAANFVAPAQSQVSQKPQPTSAQVARSFCMQPRMQAGLFAQSRPLSHDSS